MNRWLKPALLCTALVTACSPAPRPSAAQPATLVLSTKGGVEAVSSLDGALRYRVSNGVTSADGAAVLTTEGDRLVVRDARSGATRQSIPVGPGLVVSTVSGDGQLAALTTAPAPAYLPAGRQNTEIRIARLATGAIARHTLAGNFWPDAFTADGTGLFLVSYLPALAPDRYQITLLDLPSGEVRGVFGREKEALEDMRGVAGTKVFSPDRTTLYTLYLRPPAQAGPGPDGLRAEIHTLKLDQYLWAHCIDLPDGLGRDPGSTGLAVSPDGARLYALDRTLRRLVEIDTTTLAVIRSVAVPLFNPSAAPVAVVGRDGHLYVGDGASIVVIRTDTLATTGRWNTPGPVTGLVGAPGGRGVLASYERHVDALSPDGVVEATTPVPPDAVALTGALA